MDALIIPKTKSITPGLGPILIFLSFLASTHLEAQPGLRKAGDWLQKGEFEKLDKFLGKSIKKDSVNAGARYLYAQLYLDERFPGKNIDSSHHHILKAQRDYSISSEKSLRRLNAIAVDSFTLKKWGKRVDSLAFLMALEKNSVQGFNDFLSKFGASKQVRKATSLRNARAYENAQKENSSRSYRHFIHTYPEALQIEEAKRAYDRQLFKESTADQKMDSYLRFLEANPHTGYRQNAEKQIFLLSTADNSPEGYLWFARKFPQSPYALRSIDYLHRWAEDQQQAGAVPARFANDSLRQVIQQEEQPFFIIYEKGKFGFMDAQGKTAITPSYDWAAPAYHCGAVRSAYLEVGQNGPKIIRKDGHLIFGQDYEAVEQMDMGLLRIKKEGKYSLFHLSGERLLPYAYDDIKPLDKHFLLIRENGKYGLASRTGKVILETTFGPIQSDGEQVIIEHRGKYAQASHNEICRKLKEGGFSPTFSYDSIRPLGKGILWTQKEGNKALLSKYGEKTLKPRHDLQAFDGGHLLFDGQKYEVIGPRLQTWQQGTADSILLHYPWLKVIQGPSTFLYHLQNRDSIPCLPAQKIEPFPFGSILVTHTDQKRFFFPNGQSIGIPGMASAQILKSQTATDGKATYLLSVKTKKKGTTVYDDTGRAIFEDKDDITLKTMDGGYVLLSHAGKKGLMDNQGKLLLPISYDAIGNFNAGHVSLLSRGKFGLFHQGKNILIPRQFEKNILPYNHKLFIANKNNGYGLIDKKGKGLVPFSFEEIRYWTDTSALVKKDFQWSLYDIKNRSIALDHIKSLFYVNEGGKEGEKATAIVLIENKYGVMDSEKGLFIPASFDDIINLGSSSTPLYLAEKRVEEAEMHIVIYYDAEGKVLRKSALEEDEFQKLYCVE